MVFSRHLYSPLVQVSSALVISVCVWTTLKHHHVKPLLVVIRLGSLVLLTNNLCRN
jgi:hypothetical protein